MKNLVEESRCTLQFFSRFYLRSISAIGRLLKILTEENKAIKQQKSSAWYANEDRKRTQLKSSLQVRLVL